MHHASADADRLFVWTAFCVADAVSASVLVGDDTINTLMEGRPHGDLRDYTDSTRYDLIKRPAEKETYVGNLQPALLSRGNNE